MKYTLIISLFDSYYIFSPTFFENQFIYYIFENLGLETFTNFEMESGMSREGTLRCAVDPFQMQS